MSLNVSPTSYSNDASLYAFPRKVGKNTKSLLLEATIELKLFKIFENYTLRTENFQEVLRKIEGDAIIIESKHYTMYNI